MFNKYFEKISECLSPSFEDYRKESIIQEGDERGKKVYQILHFLDKKYKFKNVYYPACGDHSTPSYFFQEKIVNLDIDPEKLERLDPKRFLGNKCIKVVGDIENSPVKEKMFDLILLFGSVLSEKNLSECLPLLEKEGLILNYRYAGSVINKIIKFKDELKEIELPEEYKKNFILLKKI